MSDEALVEAAERRRFFRIDDEVALSYRLVDPDELDRAIKRLQLGYPDKLSLASAFATTSAQMHHAIEQVRRDLPEVAGYLEGINEKLDLLVQLMAAAESDLSDTPTHNVNLSASGISFDCEARLEVGATVEVKLLVFPTYACVMAFGTVVHCEQSNRSVGAGPYRIGVDFTHIRETDREQIVHHITRKQSALLREARMALETGPEDLQPG